jgi:hypothetical protein
MGQSRKVDMEGWLAGWLAGLTTWTSNGCIYDESQKWCQDIAIIGIVFRNRLADRRDRDYRAVRGETLTRCLCRLGGLV